MSYQFGFVNGMVRSQPPQSFEEENALEKRKIFSISKVKKNATTTVRGTPHCSDEMLFMASWTWKRPKK